MVNGFGKDAPGPRPPGARTPASGPGRPGADGRGWFEPAPDPAVTEPTQVLPLVGAPPPARPSPLVVARAVIVYQDRPRRPWALWVFTVAIVALTVGVVLGQTVAFEPVYRPTLDAQAATVPSAVLPSGSAPGGLGQPVPAGPQRVSAPLGKVRSRVLEVAGAATVLRVRSTDLGEALFDITTADPGTVPSLTETRGGTRLELVRTGDAATADVEIQLNAKVAWTLRLLGSSAQQDIDLRAGGAAGLELAGGSARVALRLPEPKGTVPVAVTGPVGELDVRRKAGTPVRLRLGGGADQAVVDGKTRRKVKAGAKLTSAGWAGEKNRYEVVTAGPIAAVVTTTGG